MCSNSSHDDEHDCHIEKLFSWSHVPHEFKSDTIYKRKAMCQNTCRIGQWGWKVATVETVETCETDIVSSVQLWRHHFCIYASGLDSWHMRSGLPQNSKDHHKNGMTENKYKEYYNMEMSLTPWMILSWTKHAKTNMTSRRLPWSSIFMLQVVQICVICALVFLHQYQRWKKWNAKISLWTFVWLFTELTLA